MSVSIIRLASDPSKVLCTQVATPVNGSNVEIGEASTYRSVWNVTEKQDGTCRIVSSRAGKFADVKAASIQQGTNVQLYTGNESRAQIWELEDSGSSVTYEGESYTVYNIKIAAGSFYMAQSGSNIVLGSATGFILTPLPTFEDGGVYELRSMLDKTMAVDVAAGSLTKGANVQIYRANGTNAQKVFITDEGDGYSIRSIVSGMYVDVQAGQQISGTNVQQYTDNDTRAQRWAMQQVGTTTVEGVECAVVTFGAFNALNLVMDVKAGLTTDKTNVRIYTSNNTDAQLFALYPTTAEDKNMPAPSNLGLASEIGGASYRQVLSRETVYPTWECPTSWASSGANHYEWRYASRTMGEDGTWGAWSDVTPWAAAGVTVLGDSAWLTEGLPGTFQGKALQYQLQVRSVGVGLTSSVHSPAASNVCEVDFAPTVSISSIEWTMEGMRVDYSSDYPYGMLDLNFTIEADGETLIEGYQTGFVDPSGSLIIPNGVVRAFPSDGSTADITLTVSTDMRRQTGSQSLTAPITVGSGGLDLQLTAGDIQGYGGLPVTANMECDLVLVCDGETYPLGKGTSWEALFPYGPFEVRGYAQEGTRWGVASLKYSEPPTDKRAHGWLVDGSVRALETRESGGTEESKTLTASSQNFSYAGRKREAVFFGSVTVVQMPVTGLIVEGVTGTSWEDLETMVGRRGLYRAPYGGLHKVAITGMQKDRTLKRTNVTVNQDEVDQ